MSNCAQRALQNYPLHNSSEYECIHVVEGFSIVLRRLNTDSANQINRFGLLPNQTEPASAAAQSANK